MSRSLESLREVLARFVDDVTRIKMLCADIGMRTERISWRGSAVKVWFRVLTEASKNDQLPTLLRKALREYSEYRELCAALSLHLASDHDLDLPVSALPGWRRDDLVGRAGLFHDVELALRESGRGVVLHGPSGIGKTVAAAVIAEEASRSGSFPGGVWWLDASSEPAFTEGIDGVHRALGVGAGSRSVRSFATTRERSLFVLDDLDARADWYVPYVRTIPSGSLLLVTTIHREVGWLLGRTRWVEVGPLAQSDAREFVRRLCQRLTDAQIDTLFTAVSGHTLALEIAARTLSDEPLRGFDEYLERLREGDGLEEVVGVERGVRRAIMTHIERLPVLSQRVFKLCGVLYDAPIPTDWITIALDLYDEEISSEEAKQALAPFDRRHLGALSRSATFDVLRLHTIVQRVARRHASPEDAERLRYAVLGWGSSFVPHHDEWERKALLIAPHVDRLLEVRNTNPAFFYLLVDALIERRAAGDLERAETLLTERTTHGATLDRDLPRRLLSIAHRRRGPGDDERAEQLARDLLSSAESAEAGNTSHLADALERLAAVLEDRGGRERLTEAELLLRRACELDHQGKRLEFDPSPHLRRVTRARVLAKLGGATHGAEAVQIAREAVAAHERLRGTHASSLASALYKLGQVLETVGTVDAFHEELAVLGRAIEIFERDDNTDSPDYAACLDVHGCALWRLGGAENLRAAANEVERAIEIYSRTLGSSSHQVGTARNNRALILADMGPNNLQEAARYARESVALIAASEGEDSVTMAITLNTLGQILMRLPGADALAEAEQHLRCAVELAEKHWGRDHPKCFAVYGNLAALLGGARVGRHDDALPWSRRTVAAARAGAPMPMQVRSLVNLAALLLEAGDDTHLAEAEAALEQAASLADSCADESTNLRYWKAELLWRKGEHHRDEALRIHRAVLDEVRRTEPASSPFNTRSVSTLAIRLYEMGDTERLPEALPLMREAIERKGRWPGPADDLRDHRLLLERMFGAFYLAERKEGRDRTPDTFSWRIEWANLRLDLDLGDRWFVLTTAHMLVMDIVASDRFEHWPAVRAVLARCLADPLPASPQGIDLRAAWTNIADRLARRGDLADLELRARVLATLRSTSPSTTTPE